MGSPLIRPIFLIAAVGKRGQLGLGGVIPWSDQEDLRWFKRTTMGGTLIVGPKTAEKLPFLPGRMVVHDDNHVPPEEIAARVMRDEAGQIWVAGGARTYERWMHLVRRCFVTRVDYDGEADVYMPPLW